MLPLPPPKALPAAPSPSRKYHALSCGSVGSNSTNRPTTTITMIHTIILAAKQGAGSVQDAIGAAAGGGRHGGVVVVWWCYKIA